MEHTLTAAILNLSISTYWNTAKTEWSFEYAYQSDEPQTCLCGHFPIINICVIQNRLNKQRTEVGNCCINKFLGIETGNRIFSSIKRLNKDISRSMSAEALEYLHEKKILSPTEYEFYTNTLRKRVLSAKQRAFRESINRKLLDFTSGETHAVMAKINRVLSWAENKKSFDTTFIESLRQTCAQGGRLSAKQLQSLEKIITTFKIA